MSRRRRVLLWAGLLVVLAGVGTLGVWWTSARTAKADVTLDNFRRITVGMTQKECRQILGPPMQESSESPEPGMPEYLGVRWEGDMELSAALLFDPRGRVEWGFLSDGKLPAGQSCIASLNMGFDTDHPETILARLRRWLGF